MIFLTSKTERRASKRGEDGGNLIRGQKAKRGKRRGAESSTCSVSILLNDLPQGSLNTSLNLSER